MASIGDGWVHLRYVDGSWAAGSAVFELESDGNRIGQIEADLSQALNSSQQTALLVEEGVILTAVHAYAESQYGISLDV